MAKAKKRPELKTVKRRAWEALSYMTRLQGSVDGYNHCVTCVEQEFYEGSDKKRAKLMPIRELSAGHFIPKARGNAAYFNPDNVWPQCSECNIALGGNPFYYSKFMTRQFGDRGVIKLQQDCTRTIKYTVEDYLEMEREWKEAIVELQLQ